MRRRASFSFAMCANVVLALGFSLSVGAADSAIVVFTSSGQSLGSATSRGVALGDLDGDGDLDTFVTADGANSVWFNKTLFSLFFDGFEVGDCSMWSRSEPNGVGVSAVEPDNGVDAGGDVLTITGRSFTGAIDVQIDGVSCATWFVIDDRHISCETTPHNPAIVRVTVWRDPGHGTLTGGFRFTGQDQFSLVDWAALQWPSSTNCSVGSLTEVIIGRAHATGFTDWVGPPGSAVVAEVGWGPSATQPGVDPGWLWVEAPWIGDVEAGSDEFGAALVCPAPGTYAYAFRCSADGGLNYLYGDFDPGTADGFNVSDLGLLISQ